MAGEPVVKSWDAGTRTLSVEHKRYINNNSPGTITIKEIGLIANGSQGTSLRALMSRDVLGTPVISRIKLVSSNYGKRIFQRFAHY